MNILAVQPWLPILGLAVTAPTIIVLFGGAFYLAESPRHRLANLICGLLGAMAAILGFVFTIEPTPHSWLDEYYGLIVISLAPIGAAVGIAFCVSWRLHHRSSDSIPSE